MIELRKIGHSNWMDCIGLEVADKQRQYVNPNIFSLAEAYVHSDANPQDAEAYYRCIPFALYHGDEMVGFAMVTYEKEYDFDDRPAYEIYRLMIDAAHQRKGYGKAALDLLLAYVKTFPFGKAGYVYAQWHPDNRATKQLCASAGFAAVGADDEDGAVIARLSLKV